MSKTCWKFAQFVDVKDYGKLELLMANSGIDCNKNQAETDGRAKKTLFSAVSGGLWISKNCKNYE